MYFLKQPLNHSPHKHQSSLWQYKIDIEEREEISHFICIWCITMIMTSPLPKFHGLCLVKRIAEGSSFLCHPFYRHTQIKKEKRIVFPIFHHMEINAFPRPSIKNAVTSTNARSPLLPLLDAFEKANPHFFRIL